jgi:superfamily I DNA/RNA helicase/mRNA-degrading endonuclease RelE of RelBE toxin-antitoxin system
MTEHPSIKVAISADFLKAFSRIPNAQQKKVREFVDQFQNNPASSGINYETIHGCVDSNLRSARVDQTYRAIILKPQSGNVYMLLWVDKHDDAYDWASKRKLIIHPDTGGIQVLQVEDVAAADIASAPIAVKKGLFEGIKDRQLRRLGVPDEQIPLVESITEESELDDLEEVLAQEAYEALYLLASGFEYDEVVREYELEKEKLVDTQNFSLALENFDSQRRFKVVEDALELQELLNAPLEQWRVFLHPTQRRFVEMKANGPVRVLGGAGTGKTVVAVHRAKWLATSVHWKDNDRILFTTYTKNLAADIQGYLRAICPADVLKRIDVLNLDAWVAAYLKKIGHDAIVDFDGSRGSKELWEDALNLKPTEYELSDAFFRDEWNQIIQAHGVSSLQEYFKVSRTGRGRRLSRKMRKDIWPVFEDYRALLNEKNIKETDDAYRDCRQLLADQGDILGYKAILVDEAQDFSAEAFKLLRQMIPKSANDLFIVGDAHQRIYGHRVVLGRCGIKIQGRSKKLRINYRTTDETRRFATAILQGCPVDDLDGGADDNKGYKSLTRGPSPTVVVGNSVKQEEQNILSILKTLMERGASLSGICLTCRTNKLVDQYAQFLENEGIPVCRIVSHSTHDQSKEGLRIATMHRVKGIEFDHIIVAAANEGVIPLSQAIDMMDNAIADREAEAKERALLYVSLTRARKSAFVTSSGPLCRFISVNGAQPI